MFGSSVTGFGMTGADVNMNLMYPTDCSPAVYLAKVYKLLCQTGKYLAGGRQKLLSKLKSGEGLD